MKMTETKNNIPGEACVVIFPFLPGGKERILEVVFDPTADKDPVGNRRGKEKHQLNAVAFG